MQASIIFRKSPLAVGLHMLRKATSLGLEQGPLAVGRKVIRKAAYVVQNGYWHTGERVCPDFPEENFVNHLKVYRFAAQFCSGKRVLDVGCGTGYGTSHLSECASFAVGVDLSRQAIRYAKRHYSSAKVEFLRMNAESLAFPDRSFQFVISTENFEHLRDHQANLREIARVLDDDGMLLLATPNPEMFVGLNNPYHTHEFTYDELLQIVQGFFRECLISENLLTPPSEKGRRSSEERKRRGSWGISLAHKPSLWGDRVDNACLSNTCSFFCFARSPRRPTRNQAPTEPGPKFGG
jgi:2-polyprenyl-3-methyl-5-hydroxy-6-metoxy-1,4-benzoquinol methylase